MALCERCRCCSADYEMVPCWACGGFCGPEWAEDDDWDDGWCEECQGEGEIAVKVCCGSCDKDGKHKPKVVAA